ncbi:MAG: NADH-quinone oxidoreductase subunit NuoG [Rhodocyclaceae bacterium]|nr:NADH-quinone oxidoreductase subunit NuoG [Rhodocyclaceae bacterium]
MEVMRRVTIFVDGRPHSVLDDQNLLQACLSAGLDLPYFCWHPALGSVGACRQCAVKLFRDASDRRGRIVMACMTPAADSTRISIDDAEAREFRARVIEWLMINHPHDCPVCDEGGECHLQDMTVMTGHVRRRYRGLKRTFENQDLGPFINHEMNRCIQCYRCVRFYRDFAGDRDFDAFSLRNQVYFGRQQDGTLESEFSGNLVEVCPTGVFTDKSFKEHYTRKWDLQTAPSICVHCGLGCNTIPGERYGLLRRIRNRYNGEVNGYFLCDRGRYGYGFVNGAQRIRAPLLRRELGGPAAPVERQEALARIAAWMADGARVVAIGSPRASLEANFALRALVGPAHFYGGMSAAESRLTALIAQILQRGPAPAASLQEAAEADAVLVLGEDVTNSAPMLALSLRQAVRRQPMAAARGIPPWDDHAMRQVTQGQRGPLFLATLAATRLEDVARETLRAAPADIARLGFAVAHALDADAPSADVDAPAHALAGRIAAALLAAGQPLVVAGMSCGSEDMIRAAADVAWALRRAGRPARLAFVVPECDSLGAALMTDRNPGLPQDGADLLLVMENDLYRRADTDTVDSLLGSARHVVLIDHTAHATAAAADAVLPAATFAEATGTLVNNEGRAQRYFRVFAAAGDVQESWRWIHDIAAAAGRTRDAPWTRLDDVTAACATAIPPLRRIVEAAPGAAFRIAGQKIPREPPRYSGRTAMHAQVDVDEPKPPDDPDTPLAFSMEGYAGRPPSPLIPYFWSPGWNSVQAVNKFQEEIAGPLAGGDPGVRLMAPSSGTAPPAYFREVPPAFARRDGHWLAVPLHHIFGSDELSTRSPPVASLAAQPYAALNPDDAAELGLNGGDLLHVQLRGISHRLPLRFEPALPKGLLGLPAGMDGLAGIPLPDWVRVAKAEAP